MPFRAFMLKALKGILASSNFRYSEMTTFSLVPHCNTADEMGSSVKKT